MNKDQELQLEVQNAIKWEPLLNATQIGVFAKDGVITLTGIVDTYAKKIEAEKAAKNVLGVKALVETIEIRFENLHRKSSTEIANEVLKALKWNWAVPNDVIKIKVEDGWVTLEGEVPWNYQREAAGKAVVNLTGIKGLTNYITLKLEVNEEIEKVIIERAIARSWSIADKDIHVKVVGNNVTLTGNVNSLYQKDEAERVTWNAPGVWSLKNELVIV